MPGITLDLSDATEIAETLTLLTQWLSGSQQHILAESFAAFIGHPAYNTGTLCTDLRRFASSSAPATAKTSSASRRNDQQYRSPAFPT